jgi:putative ABC transport system permease protein
VEDLRYAARILRRNPAFAVISALALALGIGANTAVFSVLNAVVLRPLPFPEPRQLVRLWDSFGTPGNFQPVSYPNFEDWRAWNHTFSGMAAFTGSSAVLTGSGDAMRVTGVIASASLLDILQVQPAIGRRFLAEEDRPHANGGLDSVIIGHRLWRERFSGSAAVLGRAIMLDGQEYAIVGVMPPGVDLPAGPADPDFWMTAASLAQVSPGRVRPVTAERGMSFLSAIGRLKPGVTAAQAQSDMDGVAAALVRTYPKDDPKEGVIVKDLQETAAGNVRPVLLLLLAAAGLVFLIACADIAGLVLARATGRRREMTLRAAIGAGRWRIARQLLAESLVLAGAGAVAGLWLATMVGRLLVAVLGITRAAPEIDLRVLGFTAAAAVLASCVFSLAPILHFAAVDLMTGLREASGAVGETRRQSRTHAAMVVVQTALAMVLLGGSGLLSASLWRLNRVDLGFAPEHVLTFPVSLPGVRYPQEQRAPFFAKLTQALQEMPGVRTAAAGGQLPLGGGISRTVISRVGPKEVRRSGIAFASITPEFFRALGIPVLRGRVFDSRDTAGAAPVVILNQAAARRYFGAADPVGQTVTPEMWNGSGSTTQPRTVVGVVGDVKLLAVDAATPPCIFWPIRQIPSDATLRVAVLAAGDPAALVGAVRERLRMLDPDLPLYDVQALSHYVEESLAPARNTAALVGVLAALALVLTAIGVYGVLAYAVARRTREIGIRIALGAARGQVLRGFLGRGLLMSVLGVAIGMPAAAASTALLKGLLFGVAGQKPVILGAGAVVMIAVAMAASYLPARRATRVDPMTALRQD